METPASFEYAKEVVTQLITLSTALIGVSIAFVADVNKSGPTAADRRWLRRSWIVLLVSVLFGVWALMGLTGTLAGATVAADSIYDSNIRIPTTLQIVTFVAGLALLIKHAWK